MRFLAVVLAALLVAIQYPLWLGKGGWVRVWEIDRQLAAQKGRNAALAARNAALDAEVRDLKEGLDAIEERNLFPDRQAGRRPRCRSGAGSLVTGPSRPRRARAGRATL
jgi:cell division protein FtsB